MSLKSVDSSRGPWLQGYVVSACRLPDALTRLVSTRSPARLTLRGYD